MAAFSLVDLFCGVGGLSHGFHRAGVDVIAGIDNDESCKYAFEENNDARFIARNIEEVTAEEVAGLFPAEGYRVLGGCAPCQPYSIYAQGDRKAEVEKKKRGRWGLLYDFAELIVDVGPDVATMENVTSLRRFDGGRVFQEFRDTLETAGYEVSDFDVYCPDYGIPQRRTRLVLMASKHGRIDLIAPTHSEGKYVTVDDVIGDVDPIQHGETHPDDPVHKASALSDTNLKRIQHSEPGGTWRDWPEELRARCHTKETGKTYPSVYGRMRGDEPAPTLTTQCYGYGNGRFGHPRQDRAISLREAALLQSFPRDYEFVAPGAPVYMKVVGRHIGNAVPPVLGRVIAESIVTHLSNLRR